MCYPFSPRTHPTSPRTYPRFIIWCSRPSVVFSTPKVVLLRAFHLVRAPTSRALTLCRGMLRHGRFVLCSLGRAVASPPETPTRHVRPETMAAGLAPLMLLDARPLVLFALLIAPLPYSLRCASGGLRSNFTHRALKMGRAGALPLQFLPPRSGGGTHGGGLSHEPTLMRFASCSYAAP